MSEKLIRKILGLTEEAEITDEHRAEAEVKMSEAWEAHTAEPAEEPEEDNASDPEPEGDTVPMSEFQALQKKVAFRDGRDAFEAALREHKVTPALRAWAVGTESKPGYAVTNPAGFASFVHANPSNAGLFTEAGTGGEDNADTDAVGERIEALKAEGKTVADAYLIVAKEFGAETVREFRFRPVGT